MTNTNFKKHQDITISVIVPVFNEINTIGYLLESVNEVVCEGICLEILVVDDGSTDGTREFLLGHTDLYSSLHINKSNIGKGGAVQQGLRQAKGDYVLFQDADLEYDPKEYLKLFLPVLNHGADVVMGSRFLAPEWTKVFYFYHKIGNKLISLLFNLLFNTTWTDIYSCYLLFKRNLIDPEKLKTLGWEQQAEILGNICLQKPELYEVPINHNGRSYEQGKKIRWHHTFKVIFTIIKTRIFPTNHSIE